MRRRFVLGVVAIAVVFGASVGVILSVTDDAPGPASASPGGPPDPAVPSPAPGPGTRSDGAAAQADPRPDLHGGSTTGDTARGEGTGRPDPSAVAREAIFKSFRRSLNVGLAELRKRVQPCSMTDAALTLTLETVHGGIRVADVKVDRQGSATSEAVACAVSALKGYVIRADSAVPGRSWQVPLFAPRQG